MSAYVRVIAAFVRRDFGLAIAGRVPFAPDMLVVLVGLVMTYFLSRVVDERELASAGGGTQGYFAFVVVGISALRVLTTGLLGGVRATTAHRRTGELEAMLVRPVPCGAIGIGLGVFELLRALAAGVASVLLAVAVFGLSLPLDAAMLGATALAMIATALLLTASSLILAAVALAVRGAEGGLGFVGGLIGLLAGVYYPPGVLPGALRAVSDGLPFTWALRALRAAVLEGDVRGLDVLGTVAAGAGGLLLGVLAFNAGIDAARRRGRLTG